MNRLINKMNIKIYLIAALSFVFLNCEEEKESTPQDWPQYKKDNHRSGNSSVQLDLTSFGEDWVYSASQLPVPAWYGPAKEDTYAKSGPLPSMRDYDLAYYPIIIGERLYYGSSSDDAIHCLDVLTGEELWTFTTGGPIRVAPTYKSGKLFFGSDDGYAYCIKASNGNLVWKFSPTEDVSNKVLNNNALISFWPVRTGVLVEQGIAYFGASLLPWKDSYFCAVDIATGKTNKKGTYIKTFKDLTLEGAMASTGTKIVQPQGRISPIFFNKLDGKSKGQLAGTGGCFVLITPELNIVHPQTSREKSIMETLGTDENRINDNPDQKAQFMSFKGGKEMVVKDSMSYILTDNSISAYNRNSKKVVWSKRNYQAHRIIISGDVLYVGGTDKLYAVSTKNGHPLWETPVKGTVYALAVANNALYASTGEGRIYRFAGNKFENPLYAKNKDKPATIDKSSTEKQLVEEGNLELSAGPFVNALGPNRVEVHFISKEPLLCTLNWANDYEEYNISENKAVTEHRIVVDKVRKDFSYRYQITVGDQKTKYFDFDNFFNFTTNELVKNQAHQSSSLLQEVENLNGMEKGLAVIFGLENEDTALEIARNTALKVMVFDTSESKINTFREQWQQTGLYGNKLSIQYTDGYSSLPLTGDVANIVIVNNTKDIKPDEVIRLIKPNGHSIIEKNGTNTDDWLAESKSLWQTERSSNDNFELLKKAPYETAGKWTHQYGLPNNSAYGGESLWGSTSTEDFEIQWMGRPGPRFQTDRSGRKPSPLAVNGKMFVQGKERIIAVDAYNGNVFWSKEIPELNRMNILHDCSNWVADDDFLYIAHKDNLLKVNSKNGKIKAISPVENGSKTGDYDWGYISLNNNQVIGSTIPKGSTYTNYYGGAGWYDAQSGPLTHQVVSSSIFGRDKNKNENSWVYKNSKAQIINATITVTENQICFVESRNPKLKLSKEGRAGEAVFKNTYLVSINPNNGEVNWEISIKTKPGVPSYFMAGSQGNLVIVASNKGAYYIYNYNAENGDFKWENELKWFSDNHGAHLSRPAIVNNRLIVKPGMFNLETGELLKQDVPKAGHGCASYALTEQSVFYRGGSVTQFNFDTNKFSKWERLRPDCWISTIPAQGMVLSPEAGGGCSCGNWLETSMVFSPKSRAPLTFVYSNTKFIDTLNIRLKSKDPNNENIYYTLDGTVPTKSSLKYKKAISIDKNTQLQAVIYVEKEGKELSFVRTKNFERVRPAPVITELPYLSNGDWKFSIETKSNTGDIHYTLDGSIPTIESPKYKEPVVFNENTKITAMTFWSGDHGSFESEPTSFEMLLPVLSDNISIEAKPGLKRNFYIGTGKNKDKVNLNELVPNKETVVSEINLLPYKEKRMFGLQFNGYIDIPEDGIYTLSSMAQGGVSTIFIHGTIKLENKGGEEKSTILKLKKGFHPLKIEYLVGNGAGHYDIKLEGRNFEKQSIPSNLLFN